MQGRKEGKKECTMLERKGKEKRNLFTRYER